MVVKINYIHGSDMLIVIGFGRLNTKSAVDFVFIV